MLGDAVLQPVRAVAAKSVLRRPGVLLSSNGVPRNEPRRCCSCRSVTSEEVYGLSKEVDSIDEFWSHSWRSHGLQKFCTLLLYYNGLTAAIGGILGSIFGGIASTAVDPSQNVAIGKIMACISGFIGFFIGVFVGASENQIFLDRACVDNSHGDHRQHRIVNTGITLRRSSKLIVLVDTTYTSRLWCVFEAATFLRFRQGFEQSLHIRPVFLGHFCIAWALASCLVTVIPKIARQLQSTEMLLGAYPPILMLAYLAREYLDQAKCLARNTWDFRVGNARCFCCRTNHTHPTTGHAMSCDRIHIINAIGQWFESELSFEQYVRQDLRKEVQSQEVLSYRYAVLASGSLAWTYAGNAVRKCCISDWAWVMWDVDNLIRSLLLKGPLTLQCFLAAAALFFHLPRTGVVGFMATHLVGASGGVAAHLLNWSLPRIFSQYLSAEGVNLACWFSLSPLLYVLYVTSIPSVKWTAKRLSMALVLLALLASTAVAVRDFSRATTPLCQHPWVIF